MTSSAEWQVLKFQPWNSAPDVSFWQKLTSLKLNEFQLDDQAQVNRRLANGAIKRASLSLSNLIYLSAGDHRLLYPRQVQERPCSLHY